MFTSITYLNQQSVNEYGLHNFFIQNQFDQYIFCEVSPFFLHTNVTILLYQLNSFFLTETISTLNFEILLILLFQQFLVHFKFALLPFWFHLPFLAHNFDYFQLIFECSDLLQFIANSTTVIVAINLLVIMISCIMPLLMD